MQLSRAKPASRGWFGTTSQRINSTGTGNALMTAEVPGACCGKSIIRECRNIGTNQFASTSCAWRPLYAKKDVDLGFYSHDRGFMRVVTLADTSLCCEISRDS